MNDNSKRSKKEPLSEDLRPLVFPIITDEEKFSKLMKDFSDAFERLEISSSSEPSLFNEQYLKDLFEIINSVRNKISKLQSLIENHMTSIASLFLCIQKNQIYEPILKNLLESKRNSISIIEEEIKKCQAKITLMKQENDYSNEELKKIKDEIDLLQSDSLFSLHEELMEINDSSIESAHQCIAYQNELNKLENDISFLHPLIGKKTEEMKSLVLSQSSLRSKLATINSQINAITTDCAALTIDLENNTKKINQGQINLQQKELELSTIENEILSQSDRIKEIELEISEKEEEIQNSKENMNEICIQIQDYKSKIEKITNFDSNISNFTEEEEIVYAPTLNQLQNKIDELIMDKEKLLSEKDCLDQRNNQLEKIIVKKNQMINEDKAKIEKKQLRYQELQEIFKLRKIMLLTAFDDIDRKYDKFYCKIHELEMQLKKHSKKIPISIEDSDNSYDADHEHIEVNKNNWNIYNPNINSNYMSKTNSNASRIQSYSQTPQIIRKFSKLFPKSNYSKNDKPTFKYQSFSPSSQK